MLDEWRQIAALRTVSERLPIVSAPGDVAALILPDGRQLVHAMPGGFDLWDMREGEHGRLLRTGLGMNAARRLAGS